MVLQNAHVVVYLQQHVGWYDRTLKADHWAALGDIAPIDAAMLLCRHNPLKSDWDSLSSDKTGSTSYDGNGKEYTPEDLRMLAQRLTDLEKAEHRPRTLRDWHKTAQAMGLKYHSWIDGYMEVTTPPAPPVADTEPAQTATTQAVVPVDASDGVEPVKVGPLPVMTKRKNRQTWRDVAWLYVVETFKAGQYSTAKDFYRSLENKAGANDSPFDKGTGVHRDSLYVREISQTVSLQTIRNAWPDIKTSR